MNFYLNYGIKESRDIEDVLAIIVDLLDVETEKRDSDYFGEYYKCKGLSFDTLKIYENNDELIQFPEKYIHIISLSIDTGKNKDRKAKYSFIKKAFEKIIEFEIFKDNVVES